MNVFRKLAHFALERSAPPLRVSEPEPLAASSAGIALGLAVVIAAMSTDAAIVRAQQPAPAPAPAAARPAPVRAYTYDAAGRRDPFVSLDRSSDPKGSARGRLIGLSGLTINEATVKGVVKSEGRLVAMLQAPDNKTYIVRPNDRLLDGAVRAVTPEAVVFVQQVDDPLSLVKQREIRKPLRPIEEGK